MIAPVDHGHSNEAPAEAFREPSERLPSDDEATPRQILNWVQRLIGAHPVASIVAGVAAGIATGWIVKRGRS